MAYKVVETDAVRDELVRTLDYLELVLFEPSFAKKLAGAYLEFLGNIKSFPAMYPEAGDSRLRAAGYRKASLRAMLSCIWSRAIRLRSFTCFINRRITHNWFSGCWAYSPVLATPRPCPAG